MSRAADVLVLRCLAFPKTNLEKPGYLAQCIDLDLAVWRPTIRDAMRELDEQIAGYLEMVHSKQELDQLVPRRAPLFPDRARYHAVAIVAALPRILRSFSLSIFDKEVSREELFQGAGA